MRKAIVIALTFLVLVSGSIFLSGCVESKVESRKEITFSEGYAKIVEIFRDADLNLPDYSKSLYANAQG